MARPRKDVAEEPINDEAQKARDYDEKESRRKDEAIAERLKESGEVEPVPDGGMFDMPDPREERAAEARTVRQVPFDHSGGQPSPLEVIAARRRATHNEDDPFGTDTPEDVPIDITGTHNLVCVVHYGGRYRIVGGNSIDFLRGMLQNEKGTKRLFRFTGNTEWQEIRATGEAIHR